MNLISKILQDKRNSSKCAFIPFLTAGFPNVELTIKSLIVLDKQGADIIELGIPYSDALADGPLIQNASKIALEQGVHVDQVLNILIEVKNKINSPIIIFTYYNPILVRGLKNFLKDIARCGAKGLIVPDLPIEECEHISLLCIHYDLELILFVSPTSSIRRITNIVNSAPGSLYLVSSTGVTGIRDSINESIHLISNYITSITDKVILLGFGISSPSQLFNIYHSAFRVDGIVVGSAFTKILSKQCDDLSIQNDVVNELGLFCRQMKSVIG
uniref:Tryptophan synthase alpha chain n=1 Tax=Polysiphonia sp. TaxID=1967842 RepID=A0A1Z1MTK0_9FLOR|nr:Tryptophan synthase alpha subunit [Polysiphonia sp.]